MDIKPPFKRKNLSVNLKQHVLTKSIQKSGRDILLCYVT